MKKPKGHTTFPLNAHHDSHTYLEKPFEHDIDNLVLLIDVIQLHQILKCVQLVFPLGFKQPLV